MKKVLVVYYSQSGQLGEIVQSLTGPLAQDPDVELVVELVVEQIKPTPPYPFPWSAMEFVDVFPESLQEVPCQIEAPNFDPHDDFDLIILAYSVWYLSPAIPITAFLESEGARQVIADRPVVTLIGCRNMWLLAHEKVKRRILDLGGSLAGNIVLADRTGNLVGVATIAYWMLTGKKERPFGILPEPGIAADDIRAARRFGDILSEELNTGAIENLHQQLLKTGALTVAPAFILFERRIHVIFNVWAAFIRRAGAAGDPTRRGRLRVFLVYLLVAIFMLAPLATVAGALIQRIKKKKVAQLVQYFENNTPPKT